MRERSIAVVAMPEEVALVDGYDEIIVTGVGGVNIINSLSKVDRNIHIHNIGYAGSNNIPVGTKIRVGKVFTYHPNAKFEEPEFILDGNINCYTSGDFVLSTDIKSSCVFDMELAYICALGFKKVTAEKIVSDCLNIQEFEGNVKKWQDQE